MMHHVYIAASSSLLDWSTDTDGRLAVKVGESRNPDDRESFLSGRHPRTGGHGRACGGFNDWKVVADKLVPSRDDALDLEERFKASFAPANLDMIGAGESDIVLLPVERLTGEKLAKLDADVRELYAAASSGLYRAIRSAAPKEEPYISDEQREADRDRAEFEDDEAETRAENEDRAESHRDGGFYYED